MRSCRGAAFRKSLDRGASRPGPLPPRAPRGSGGTAEPRTSRVQTTRPSHPPASLGPSRARGPRKSPEMAVLPLPGSLHPRARQSPPPLGRLHVGTSDTRRSPRAPQSGGRCGGSRWRELVWQASVLVTLPGRWEGCPHSSAWPSGPSTGTLLSPEARCGCVCEHRRRPRQAPGPVAGQAASAPSCVEATLPEPSREQGAISA